MAKKKLLKVGDKVILNPTKLKKFLKTGEDTFEYDIGPWDEDNYYSVGKILIIDEHTDKYGVGFPSFDNQEIWKASISGKDVVRVTEKSKYNLKKVKKTYSAYEILMFGCKEILQTLYILKPTVRLNDKFTVESMINLVKEYKEEEILSRNKESIIKWIEENFYEYTWELK
jgi:hypothetical protein